MPTITRNEVRRLIDAALAGAVDPRIREALVASAISGFQASGTRLVEEPELPERVELRSQWEGGSRAPYDPARGVFLGGESFDRWQEEAVRRYNAKVEVLEVAEALEAAEQYTDWRARPIQPPPGLKDAAARLRAAYEEER